MFNKFVIEACNRADDEDPAIRDTTDNTEPSKPISNTPHVTQDEDTNQTINS